MRSDAVGYDEYTACVIESLEEWSDKLGRKAETLYLGGGTPSLIGGKNIAFIVRRAKELFGLDGEITAECNSPEDVLSQVDKILQNYLSKGE